MTGVEDLSKTWVWFLVLGIVLIVLGAFAVTVPLIPGLAVVIIIGIVLLVSGASHIIHSFSTMKWRGVFFELLSGIIYSLAGLMLVMRPGAGLAFFTLLIAMLLIMEGFFEFFSSLQLPRGSGWGWLAFGGIVNVLLGVFIWRRWPISAVWFVGLLIGLNMIFKGWGLTWLSLCLKKGCLPEGVHGDQR
jgi:uncharacterized membrane protein HdeD (DUF308 family)